ncbi:MAG: L,D-transpeptidase/peptidoglycan binding protein [Tissierellia bacterium]|nr:L,D-transpeptidase/peptidoglycan binding protein [Tissierellia bacterium]
MVEKMKKTIGIVLTVILGIILAVYIGGVAFFSNYFLPKTYINGKDVSLTKKTELDKTYSKIWDTFQLNIQGRNNKQDKISAKEIDYVEKLKKGQSVPQLPYYWFISSLQDKNYKLEKDRSFNEQKLTQVMGRLHVLHDKDITDPVDAMIGYEEGKGYVIIPEVKGTRIVPQALREKILKGFEEERNVLKLDDEGLYADPEITSDNPILINKTASLNRIDSFILTYDFEDRKEELKGESLVNLHDQQPDGTLVPSEEKVKEYIANLAARYDTYRTTRDFQITGGGTVRIKGGIYGWQTDQVATTAALLQAIQDGKTVTMKPVYNMEAMSRATNDIGSSYVEIDIARQHMWVYKDGQMVTETPVVTGNPYAGNATPTGVGKVWSKEQDRFLTGADYRSYVRYWMPFNWSGCGIHDSSWRSRYGGNIYKGGGSHGCVNTPPANIKTVFNNTVKGTPVVVYNSATQKIS